MIVTCDAVSTMPSTCLPCTSTLILMLDSDFSCLMTRGSSVL
jgi:hypothetical protein